MRAQVLLELGAAEATAFEPDSAIGHLRKALAADIEAEQRLGATMLLCGLLGHLYRLDEAADVLEVSSRRSPSGPTCRRPPRWRSRT